MMAQSWKANEWRQANRDSGNGSSSKRLALQYSSRSRRRGKGWSSDACDSLQFSSFSTLLPSLDSVSNAFPSYRHYDHTTIHPLTLGVSKDVISMKVQICTSLILVVPYVLLSFPNLESSIFELGTASCPEYKDTRCTLSSFREIKICTYIVAVLK